VPHLDSELLALLALGDHPAAPDQADHLASCSRCRYEMDSLRAVAGAARDAGVLRNLPPPPERVWQRIAAETRPVSSTVETVPSKLDGVRRRRWVPQWKIAVTAVATALATLGVVVILDREPEPQVAARAALERYGDAPSGAAGSARVLREPTGERLHVHADGLPPRTGYFEVWLIDPDTGAMISVGVLGDGPDALLPLPSTVDLGSYRLVDVSAEDYDGKTGHSGDSLLRGTLTR